ncbi:MAG TPA: sigma-70 family RNA polymerase sigma factor [Bryobacteraceae bacterium]|jgi:RNA polymerase sigma factor (sigma-70 family)|nr:sigma-70 family RNA polymerase sigma factor [Bryobacteraceae bacterium]
MHQQEWWAKQFEENRDHLRAVAYRMLGSASEADDAVQEAWLRLSRSDAAAIENFGGWLTTVVARVCLDTLRSRSSRREDALDTRASEAAANWPRVSNPEQEALLADSVRLALLVMLDRLTPAERVAFVLHDMFDVSFNEIASIVGRSPAAARQLASRARRRVQGAGTPSQADLHRQRRVVDAFLSALRGGDFEGLIAVLDPDVVVRIDEIAARPGAPRVIHGAQAWAKGAVAFAQMARSLQTMLVDGTMGLVWAPAGRLSRVLKFTVANEKIVAADIIADPARLRELHLTALDQ